MKRISQILYLIGSIYGFVGSVGFLIAGSIFTGLGAAHVFVENANTTAADAATANLTFIIVGIVFLCLAVPYILSGVFGLKARTALYNNDPSEKAPHIVALVFGIVCNSPLIVVPAIFSLLLRDPAPLEKEEVDGEVVE